MTLPKAHARSISFSSALLIRKSTSIQRQAFTLHLFYVSVRISLSYIFAFIVIYCPVETVTIWSEVDLIQTEEARNSDTLSEYCFHIKWFVHVVVVCLDCLIVFFLEQRPQMSHSGNRSQIIVDGYSVRSVTIFFVSFQPSCHWQQLVCFAVNSRFICLAVKVCWSKHYRVCSGWFWPFL